MKFAVQKTIKRHWNQPGTGHGACPQSRRQKPIEQDAAVFLQGEKLCQTCVFLAAKFCAARRKEQALAGLRGLRMKDDLLAKGTVLFQCSGRCGWDVFVDSIDPRLPDGPIFCSECDKQRADLNLDN